MSHYAEQARTVRAHLIERGGDPRTTIALDSSAAEDEAQAAALDAIDEIIDFFETLAADAFEADTRTPD